MAAGNQNGEQYLPDGSFDFSGGVDSSVVTTLQSKLVPNGLPRDSLAWLNNATVRGGGITQRTGLERIKTLFGAGGHFQGGYLYEPDSANPYLVFAVSGVLYAALLEEPFSVTDLTAGNPSLQNPPGAERCFFCQGENWLIIQAGDFLTAPVPTLPLFYNGLTLRRSIGIVTAAPLPQPGQNELPAATAMDYYAGRLWYAQARTYAAGDMVGGPSGTPAQHKRDSIFNVTENPLAFGGDGFTVPTNAGNIRAIYHSANLNATLGQGPLYIATRKTIYSLEVPVTRTDWINASSQNQPLQTVVQLVNGSVNDRSVVKVNGDVFYQSLEPAIRSFQVSLRNFGQWANTPISQNELRALAVNDRGLMRFSGGIAFDNRMLQCALPVLAGDGVNVVHQALLPLDFETVSNLRTVGPTDVSGTSAMSAPVWEGAYDGLQFLQLFVGDFGGLDRAFAAVISEVDQSLQIWEFKTGSTRDAEDNRVTWAFESPAFTWWTSGLETKRKQLKGGEIWADNIQGTVDIDIYYREDADPCWRFWTHQQVCASRNCVEADQVCVAYPPKEYRAGYRYPIVLPEPPPACDPNAIRPTTIGYQFQVKILIKGWMRVRGLILYAIPHTEPQYHGLACQPKATAPGLRKIPVQTFIPAASGSVQPPAPTPGPPPPPPPPPPGPPPCVIQLVGNSLVNTSSQNVRVASSFFEQGALVFNAGDSIDLVSYSFLHYGDPPLGNHVFYPNADNCPPLNVTFLVQPAFPVITPPPGSCAVLLSSPITLANASASPVAIASTFFVGGTYLLGQWGFVNLHDYWATNVGGTPSGTYLFTPSGCAAISITF
jgi:hypothetical protein